MGTVYFSETSITTSRQGVVAQTNCVVRELSEIDHLPKWSFANVVYKPSTMVFSYEYGGCRLVKQAHNSTCLSCCFHPEPRTIKSEINKTQHHESGGRSCVTNPATSRTQDYSSTAKRLTLLSVGT